MELELTNFKCWEYKKVVFKPGINLLSGRSGIGKSSFMDAAFFALYGTRNSNYVKKGAEFCKVVFKFDGMKIERTNVPAIVKVNDTFEDDEAQSMINAKFGKLFKTIGYMPQDNSRQTPFVLMKPGDKEDFLSQLVYEDIDILEFMDTLKTLQNDRTITYKQTEKQYETVKEFADENPYPDRIPFPAECDNKVEFIENMKYRRESIKTEISTAYKTISTFRDALEKLRIFDTYQKAKTEEITTCESEITALREKIKDVCIDALKEEKHSIRFKLQKLSQYNSYIKLQEDIKERNVKYEEVRKSELEAFTEKKNALSEMLWKEENEDGEIVDGFSKEEAEEDIENMNSTLSIFKNIQATEDKLSKIKKDVESELEDMNTEYDEIYKSIEDMKEHIVKTKMYSKNWPCPNCKTNVCFHNESLVKVDKSYEENKVSVKDLEKKLLLLEKRKTLCSATISKLQEKVNNRYRLEKELKEYTSSLDEDTITEMDGDVGGMIDAYIEAVDSSSTYYKTNMMNEAKLRDLEKENIHTSSDLLLQEITNIQKSIDKYAEIDYSEIETSNEEELNERSSVLGNEIYKYKETISSIEELDGKIKDIRDDIDRKEGSIPKGSKKISDLEVDIEAENVNVEFLIEEQKKTDEKLEKIDVFLKYKDNMGAYYKYQNRLKEVDVLQKIHKRKMASSKRMGKLIKSTKMKMFAQILRDINNYASGYIDAFFDEDDMTAQLQNYKELKKDGKSAGVHMVITYKGIEKCDPGILSGGELQRLTLAFTLALAEYQKVPFLLLDECTSHLDSETTNKIISHIKGRYSGSTVIFIAHQVVQGTFDNIVTLE